jgi:FixJ family two-component response regulator
MTSRLCCGCSTPSCWCTDTASSLRLFERHAGTLCLLVIDIALSGISGLELLNRLPTRTPRIPVLLITGLGEREIEGKVPPHCLLLQKPFTAAELFNTVQAAISAAEPPGCGA